MIRRSQRKAFIEADKDTIAGAGAGASASMTPSLVEDAGEADNVCHCIFQCNRCCRKSRGTFLEG